MKEIPLSKGKVALVDDDDFEALSQYKWHALSRGYAVRTERSGGKRTIYMHRELVQPASGMVVDHIDGDGFNNQRSNLRVCSQHQNLGNLRSSRGTSKYKGVSWDAARRKWAAFICVAGRRKNLGRYETEEEAARAYDAAARDGFGPFAKVNFNGP